MAKTTSKTTKISSSQAKAIQSQINTISAGIDKVAKDRGVTLKPNSSGGFSAVPISNPTQTPKGVKFNGQVLPIPEGMDANAYLDYLESGQPTNTNQPSPKTANATPTTGGQPTTGISQNPITTPNAQPQFAYQIGSLNDRTKLAAQYGIQNYTGTAQQNQDLVSKYNAIHQAGVPNGVNLNESGAGRQAVQETAQKVAPETGNPLDALLDTTAQTDEFFSGLVAQIQEYFNPTEQKKSLSDTYKEMWKDSGIEAMDTELMNTKNIIEGTEDDIRTEVTKAGGFATDSQVLALTNARNKQLIKNYNTLLEARNQKEEYVNTMIGLAEKDRAYADQKFDSMLNFSFQILNYRDKMKENARNSYLKIADKVGYGGLAKMVQGDAHATSLVESTLGLPTGGLAQLASLPTSGDNEIVKLGDSEAILIDKNTGKIVSRYGGTVSPTGGEPTPPPTSESGSILAQTGLSLPAFNFLTQGTTALSRLPAAQRNTIMNEANAWLNANGIDVSTFQSQYKAANETLQKNIMRANQTQIMAGEVMGSADALAEVIGEKNMGNGWLSKLTGIGQFKAANILKLMTGEQVNDPTTIKYQTQLSAMANDYAGYLAAARGANMPELIDKQEAANVISNGLNSGSVEAFKSAVEANEAKVLGVVNKSVDTSRKQVWSLFGVGDRYQPMNETPQTGILTSPDGTQYVNTAELTPDQIKEAKANGWK